MAFSLRKDYRTESPVVLQAHRAIFSNEFGQLGAAFRRLANDVAAGENVLYLVVLWPLAQHMSFISPERTLNYIGKYFVDLGAKDRCADKRLHTEIASLYTSVALRWHEFEPFKAGAAVLKNMEDKLGAATHLTQGVCQKSTADDPQDFISVSRKILEAMKERKAQLMQEKVRRVQKRQRELGAGGPAMSVAHFMKVHSKPFTKKTL